MNEIATRVAGELKVCMKLIIHSLLALRVRYVAGSLNFEFTNYATSLRPRLSKNRPTNMTPKPIIAKNATLYVHIFETFLRT